MKCQYISANVKQCYKVINATLDVPTTAEIQMNNSIGENSNYMTKSPISQNRETLINYLRR
jgi:hypothetical protein